MEIALKDYKLLSLDEHKSLLRVRNLPEVRSGARTKDVISLKSHLKWIGNLNDRKKYYAVFVDGQLRGGVNWFYRDLKDIEWGIFLGNNVQPLISNIIAYIFLNRVFDYFNIDRLVSEITIDNISAYRFSINLGMEVVDKNDGYYQLLLTKDMWSQNKNSRFIKSISKRLNNFNIEFIEE